MNTKRSHHTESDLRFFLGRRGVVFGDFFDPERIAAWTSPLERLGIPLDQWDRILALVLIEGMAHGMEPLPLLQELADRATAKRRQKGRTNAWHSSK